MCVVLLYIYSLKCSGSGLSNWILDAPCAFPLHAANGTKIKTYGSKSITLNLGLRRKIRWIFIIADMQQPIIGSDLLEKFDLLVDIKKQITN